MPVSRSLLDAKIPGPETGIEIKKSICAICDPNTQCGLDVFVRDGVIVKVEGSEEHPYNKGGLCSKGAATRQYVCHSDRIRTPLRRTGPRGSGAFEPISWDEAEDEIAARLNAAKAESGPESVVFYAGYAKYFRPFLQRLARSFGSPNYCTESSACSTAATMAQKLVFGNTVSSDIAATNCLLVWSNNPFYTNPGIAGEITAARERGMKMIVVDPRITPTSSRADVHLRLRPGADGALALAMANVIISESLFDADFVRDYTYGFEEYRKYAAGFPPHRGEQLTGVAANKIIEAARMFASVKPACVKPSASPVVHHTNGVQNYRAVFMLAALTGNYDIYGGNLAQPRGFMGSAGFETRSAQFEAPKPLCESAPRLGADRFPVWMELGSEAQAMVLPDRLRTGRPYPIKALLSLGMNHRMWPDPEGFAKSLDKLDFIANADLFMTDTCKYADIVLPACSSLERSELRCYAPNYVMLSRPAIAPLFESRSDADIIFALASRICPHDDLLALGYEACLDWILKPSGMTTDLLKQYPGGMPAPNPIIPQERKYRDGLKTPSGKVEFRSRLLEQYGLEPLPLYRPPELSAEAAPDVAAEYPLILNTGSRLPMYIHTRTYRLSRTAALRPLMSADLNPEDAAKLGVAQDDAIRVSTPDGSIELAANLTQMSQPGVVHIYHGNAEADVNTLFRRDYLDPISGFPGFKSALCKVERIGGIPGHV